MGSLQKNCKVLDKVVECVDCAKRFHAKCSDLSVDELIMIENAVVIGIAQSARRIAAYAVVLF